MKYSDTDLALIPDEDKIEHDFLTDVGVELEEAIETEEETFTIGYKNKDTGNNDFLQFDYKIKDSQRTYVVVVIDLMNSWSEGN